MMRYILLSSLAILYITELAAATGVDDVNNSEDAYLPVEMDKKGSVWRNNNRYNGKRGNVWRAGLYAPSGRGKREDDDDEDYGNEDIEKRGNVWRNSLYKGKRASVFRNQLYKG